MLSRNSEAGAGRLTLPKAIHGVDSYELVRSPEKVWGGPDKNGSWNGMLGMLQREVSPEKEGMMVKPQKRLDIHAFGYHVESIVLLIE